MIVCDGVRRRDVAVETMYDGRNRERETDVEKMRKVL